MSETTDNPNSAPNHAEIKWRTAAKVLAIATMADTLDDEDLEAVIQETAPTGANPNNSVYVVSLKVKELRETVKQLPPDESLSGR